jgi:hypothetical protein
MMSGLRRAAVHRKRRRSRVLLHRNEPIAVLVIEVAPMAAEEKKKAPAHKGPVDPKQEAKEAKHKAKQAKAKEAKKAEATAVAAAPPKEKAPEAPRPPADPRMKFFKKIKGRFLPKGPLRDRHREILTRWNASEDHAGVTVEELQSLVADWRATKVKPAAKV